jgi:hypothetical protein
MTQLLVMTLPWIQLLVMTLPWTQLLVKLP